VATILMSFLRINCPNVIGLVWRPSYLQCHTASGATGNETMTLTAVRHRRLMEQYTTEMQL